MPKTAAKCARCDAPADVVLADNSWQWDYCTPDATTALGTPFGYRILYVWPANGQPRELLSPDTLALLR